jgi:uridine kinase
VSVTHAHLLDRLAAAIADLHPHRRLRVAIDGVDGAGKTTLADALAPLVSGKGRPVIRASVDHFHNPRSMRYARGRYSPDGFYLDSYDYGALRALLLDPLGPGGSGRHVAQYFDHERDQRLALQEQQAAPTAALILDGIFLHRPELRDYWDISIFLTIDFKNSLPRGAQRGTNFDGRDPESPAHRRYVGGQRRYLAECKPERRANIAIDYNDLGKPKILKWF